MRFIAEAMSEVARITEGRRARLLEVCDFVEAQAAAHQVARLTFVCTHNSRRSQMAQILAQTAAHHFGVRGVETYSGGTEATAFDPRAAAALHRAGFLIEEPAGGDNPVYRIRFAEGASPMECFSKLYDQPPNPTRGFCAVMTCAAADRTCPIVPGAARRVSVPYSDPRAFDGTKRESTAYDESCRQIAREMLFVFSRVGG